MNKVIVIGGGAAGMAAALAAAKEGAKTILLEKTKNSERSFILQEKEDVISQMPVIPKNCF